MQVGINPSLLEVVLNNTQPPNGIGNILVSYTNRLLPTSQIVDPLVGYFLPAQIWQRVRSRHIISRESDASCATAL